MRDILTEVLRACAWLFWAFSVAGLLYGSPRDFLEQDYFWAISMTMLRFYNLGWSTAYIVELRLERHKWLVRDLSRFPIGRSWIAMDMKQQIGDQKWTKRKFWVPFYFMAQSYFFYLSFRPKKLERVLLLSTEGSLVKGFTVVFVKSALAQRQSVRERLRQMFRSPQPAGASIG